MKIETLSQITWNLDGLLKTKSLPRLVGARPKRQKNKRGTQSTENAEFEDFFPNFENEQKVGSKIIAV